MRSKCVLMKKVIGAAWLISLVGFLFVTPILTNAATPIGEFPIEVIARNAAGLEMSDTILLTILADDGFHLPGDINDDAVIDIFDILLVLEHISGRAPLTGGAFIAADLNGAGTIDIFDILLMLGLVT